LLTDRDQQLDKALAEALDSIEAPPASAAARRHAIAMARAEFEAAQAEAAAEPVMPRETGEESPRSLSELPKPKKITQGMFGWLRLIVRNQADKRRAPMYTDNKLAYGGIAAVAVGAIAVGITLQHQPQLVNELSPVNEDVALFGTPGEYTGRPDRLYGDTALEEVTAEAEVASRPVPRPASMPSAGLASNQAAAIKAKPMEEAIADYAMSAPAQERAVMAQKRMASGIVADADIVPHPGYREEGRDRFEEFAQNPVKLVAEDPVSTFSADVDTASYSFVRRVLASGVLPQPDAVRPEEMINYFDYNYPLPATKEEPFQPTVAVTDSPWAPGRKLMHIGIKGYDIAPQVAPRSNLVFLLDVSGSMNSPDKLPLVKQSMELLLTTLHPEDTVAVAVYAGAAGTVLEPTPVKDRQKILGALRNLSAGGSTAGAQGIKLAYELAASSFDEGAVNRVILATDGDFNVGITGDRELQGFIERKRDEGIFLSVLGFGQGNYQDALMQTLAQNGNGVAAYIDTLGEAQKVLVDEATSTLFPIARDVKFQVEFNPATVSEYRLIGYETRHLNREDFNNDAVEAGDLGAGHTVTAIYEFTPVGSDARLVEESRYAPKVEKSLDAGDEYAFLKIRYKLPQEKASHLITRPVTRADSTPLGAEGIGHEAGFATAVAGFAQLLKGGRYTGDYSYDEVIELALKTRGQDPYGYRNEFVQLVRKARTAAAMR